jgi:RNA polymerase sigma-70 factor (ECF subfamily)
MNSGVPPVRLVGAVPRASGSYRPTNDADLVNAVGADDAWAPAMLWERYSPSVRRMMEKALGPGPEIEDLTQEVFLRLFVRLRSLRDPSALRAFVQSVAANVLKWELRRRWVRRNIRLSPTGTLPDLGSRSDDPEARQALQRCYLVFETLTANERVAFVLRYMEEMTVDEVAAALSVSLSTAKRYVNRAASKVAARVAQDADLRSFFVPSGKGQGERHGQR